MFHVGQKVVYITGIYFPKNSIHTVVGISDRPCGCVALDLGLSQRMHHSVCNNHADDKILYTTIMWFAGQSFRPLQYDSSAISELISKEIIEERSDCQPIEIPQI